MRRRGHRHSRLPDGQKSHSRGDEDELTLCRRKDGADTQGVAAPSESVADESAGLDGRHGGAIELGEKISRLQRARILLDGTE